MSISEVRSKNNSTPEFTSQAGYPSTNKWAVAAALGFGALMSTIDASIVNVAMPQIRGAVGATVQEITWIATGYAIAMVLVMPLTAFLGRQFGQKRVYIFCLGLLRANDIPDYSNGYKASIISR